MICPECGFENKKNAKFCSKCGTKLKNEVSRPVNSVNSDSDDKSKLIIAVTIVIVVAIALFTCYSLGVFGGGETYDSSSADATKAEDSGVSQVSLSAFPVSEAPFLASEISKTGSADSVNFKGVTLTKSQVAYILTKSIAMIGSGDSHGTINVGSYSYAGHPSGADRSQSISSAQYIDMCNRFSSWIERNHQVPNYVGINTGGVPDISPTKMINICINILVQYKNTGSLPSSVSV
ncbi:MAG: zinc-ribbon domain-containing protein [Methanobrevibacter sp.]|uniref:pseudomurein-binding repeat-containing protein n=1 Tax=Methanobrevibacter sp. TaxID=66852 RepID=UPI0026E1130D|nr:pseudomurein-binding repeat-containing protein [Methanobrevibacter sp.]MDO5849101.1 zinc-ribbon domain-containing protein [Methanobrevibacter sp.]